jgi:hypothetical protein
VEREGEKVHGGEQHGQVLVAVAEIVLEAENDRNLPRHRVKRKSPRPLSHPIRRREARLLGARRRLLAREHGGDREQPWR